MEVKEFQQEINQKGVFTRLLSYTKAYKRSLLIAFIFLTIGIAGQVTGPYLVKIFIDKYLIPEYFPFYPLMWFVIGYIAIYIISAVFQYLQSYWFHKIALNIIQEIRVQVFTKVHKLGLRFFDKASSGSLVSRITNDTEAIKDLFVSVLSVFVQSIMTLIGIFIAMFILNVKLAVFCLFLLPVIFMIMYFYRKLSSRYYHHAREYLSGLNAKLSESLQGMSVIQLFLQEKRLKKEFSHINSKHYHAQMGTLKLDGLLLRPATDLVFIIALMIVLYFFGSKSLESSVEIGVLFAFVNYLERFFEPVNQMMMRLSMFQQAIVSASRVFNLMDETELAPEGTKQSNAEIESGKVEFRNVSFSYDGNKKVLKNISFTASPGDTIALVGHTGSGKSSIINLLMHFYDNYEGEILLDGKRIHEFSNSELRNKIGLVLQDPFMFAGDVNQNIRLYNEKISGEDIKEAASFVQADPFIQKLSNQYETIIGEKGSSFSSGQRQLLAFARTMAMKPKVLVLDEATANIDTETETLIQQGLEKMRKGRTTIAIAHRLSTIQNADQIIVLHQGEIVERGSHHELLEEKGLYYKMYLLQRTKAKSK